MSLTLLIPIILGLCFLETSVSARYLTWMGAGLVVGNLLRLVKQNPKSLTRRQALALTGISWVFLSLFAAFPLYFSGHFERFLDAYFDCVSGLTTTGASLILDVDHLSVADNCFRFILHYVGGMGLIVVALSLGLFGRRITTSLYNSEARNDHVVPNIVHTTQFIARVSTGIISVGTVVLAVIFVSLGLEPVRAFLNGLMFAISAFMTGGFSPVSNSVVPFHSALLELALVLIMLLGATNFLLYKDVCRGKIASYFKDIETHTMVVWFVIMALVLACTLAETKLFNDLPLMVGHGLFTLVSAATTSGFQDISSNQLLYALSNGVLLVIALLMIVGGSAGSTAGGIKFLRLGVIVQGIKLSLKQALSPESAQVSVSYFHCAKRSVQSPLLLEALSVFALMMIAWALGTLAAIAHGYDAVAAIFESASMAGNAGLSAGIIAPHMPVELEIFYIIQMWAGRLEFVALLALMVEFALSCTIFSKRKMSNNFNKSHVFGK